MSASTLIATKDLKLRVRDRSAFIIGIIAPLALAFIFDLVFGNALSANSLDLDYGIVDLDQTEISESLEGVLEALEDEGILTIQAFGTQADAEAAVDENAIKAFFLIEEGMGDALRAQDPFTLHVVGDIDAPTSTQIATSIADQFSQGVAGAQISVGVTIAVSPVPPMPEQIGQWSQTAAAEGRSFTMVDVSAATRQLDGATYFAAGLAVFFLFFTVQFGVSGILEEERDGTLARLLAAPIGRTSVITGKAILSFALGIISMTVLIAATSLTIEVGDTEIGMGADWGAPVGVASLVIAGVLSAVAIMGLVASIAKTPEGAGNLGAIIAVTLGMLGGTFFPVGQGDDLLSRLSYLTPHAWFMRGLGDLSDGAEWTAALPAAGAILLFAVLFGSAAWILLTRRMKR